LFKEPVSALAASIAIQDPAQALLWSVSLHSAENQRAAVEQSFRIWADRSPEGAIDFFAYGADSIGIHGDQARRAVVEILASRKPREALLLLEGVVDEDSRSEWMLSAFVTWHANEPEAAVAWLGKNRGMAHSLEELHRFYLEGDR